MVGCRTHFNVGEKIEKLDKMTGKFVRILQRFLQFFVMLCCYGILSLLLSFAYKQPRSISLESFHLIIESIRTFDFQDLGFFVSVCFQSKFGCMLLAFAFVAEVGFFVSVIFSNSEKVTRKDFKREEHNDLQKYTVFTNTVSYKQHVSFLA